MTSMEKLDQSRALLEQLCMHFDLTHEPFAPSGGFFFGGGQREHVLETLRHLTIFGDQVLLLTGGKGAGKTKIIDEFIRRHAEEVDIVSLAAGAGQAGETSIQRFAMLCDVPVVKGEPARQTLQRLVQKFDQIHVSSGQRTLLVVDDADLLPKDELRLYVTVFRDLPPETGAVLLLTGSEELVDGAVAGSNIARDEWFHEIPLRPLGSEDVVAYLQGWLEASGYRGHLNLGESQAAHLVEMGRGMPGRINRLFPGLVLGSQAPEPAPARVRIGLSSQAMMVVVGGLFLVCFAVVAYQYGIFSSSEKTKPDVVTGVVQDAPQTSAPVQDPSAESRLQSIDAALKSLEQEAPVEGLDTAPDPESALAVSEEQWVESEQPDMPMQELVVQREPMQALQPAVEVEPVSEAAVQQEQEQEQENVSAPEPEPETTLAPPAVQSAPKPVPAPELAKSKVEAPAQEKTQVVTQDKVAEPQAIQAVHEKAAPASGLVLGGLRSAEWVRSQAPKAYSAQVLGSFSEQAVQKFIDSNKDARKDLYYIKTRLKGKDWYVALYGVFPNRSVANAALAKAPKKIREQKPWLRSFDGIVSSLP